MTHSAISTRPGRRHQREGPSSYGAENDGNIVNSNSIEASDRQSYRDLRSTEIDTSLRNNKSVPTTVATNIRCHEKLVRTEEPLLLESYVEGFNRQTRRRLSTQMTSPKGPPSETFTISVSTYNEMKRGLEFYKRTTSCLDYSIEMWEETCSEYNVKVEKVVMVTECSSNTAPTSATRSSSCHLVSDHAKSASCQKNNYFNEMNELKVPFKISTLFTKVFDKMTSLAYLFILEVYGRRWTSLHSKLS